MSRDEVSLKAIYQAGTAAVSYTRGLSRKDFQLQTMRLQAVKYEIVIIGEAARRLSSDFRERHPDISWKKMIGMRNILVHQYNKVDINLLWDVIQNGILDLLARLQLIMMG